MSLIGLRVGPFEIVENALVPASGLWYLARRVGMTRRQPAEVLVKLLSPDAPPEQRAALQAEFEVLRSLDDPRVPKPVAFYEGTGAMAVEALPGVPVTWIVEARRHDHVPMTAATALDLGVDIAEALQHAHSKGRIHGHLSARNVLLSQDGRLWLWGFGEPAGTRPHPAWTPPELARGESAGEASDQWALGALLYGFAVGQPVWGGEHPLVQARAADPRDVVAAIDDRWPGLARVVRRMLEPHPANRHPSMSEVRQELLALSRKARGSSSRRELAAQITRIAMGMADEPDETPTAEPTWVPAPERVSGPGAQAGDTEPSDVTLLVDHTGLAEALKKHGIDLLNFKVEGGRIVADIRESNGTDPVWVDPAEAARHADEEDSATVILTVAELAGLMSPAEVSSADDEPSEPTLMVDHEQLAAMLRKHGAEQKERADMGFDVTRPDMEATAVFTDRTLKGGIDDDEVDTGLREAPDLGSVLMGDDLPVRIPIGGGAATVVPDTDPGTGVERSFELPTTGSGYRPLDLDAGPEQVLPEAELREPLAPRETSVAEKAAAWALVALAAFMLLWVGTRIL